MSKTFKSRRRLVSTLVGLSCLSPSLAWAQGVPSAEGMRGVTEAPPAAPAPAPAAPAPAPAPAAPAAPAPPPGTGAPAQPAPGAAAGAGPTEALPATANEEAAGKPGKGGKQKQKNRRRAGEPGRGEASSRDREGMLENAPDAGETDGVAFTSSGGSLQLKGRIFALAELSHRRETVVNESAMLEERDRNSLDLSLESARFGIEYRSPLPWLSADLDLEIAGKPEVKDAYILAGKRLFVKAGQFKLPTAAIELESPWALPIARRGLVHDLLTDWLDVAGRRPGVAVGYRGKGGIKPRLTLGAFQGTVLEQVAPGDRDVELIDHAALDAQSFAARGELTLGGVAIGLWYEHRVGSTVQAEFEHYATLGLDARLDKRFETGGLRFWVDGIGGESFYVADDKPGDDQTPWFVTARALVGYRFGGLALGEPYIEPFGHFALLDPDTEVVSDFVTEAAIGVNAGFWDRARVTLQGEMTSAQRNLPKGLLDNQEPDHWSLLLQAGARF
jgi:hypothetical protein